MGVKQIKVLVNELTVGMFVSGLDRPWTQTPFPLQGFLVKDMEDVKKLKLHCHHVYIDVAKGSSPIKTNLKTLQKNKEQAVSFRKNVRTAKKSAAVNVTPIKIRRNAYEVSAPIEKEIVQAKALHQQVFDAVGSVMEQVERDHHNVPVTETRRVASEMVDSVLRSPDAFTWLSRVREKDEYTYSHAVRSAVWAILFGRHIGLTKADLDVLAMGVLLKDIGKTQIPTEVLSKSEKTFAEQQEYEKFVNFGVDILSKLPDVKPRIISVVRTHCERVNGSGFPAHLSGDKIPLLGKIAGIVTFYDETTNPRGQSKPLSPSKAVKQLYQSRDVEFQEDLVVEFIRAIGLYPTGTLIELSSGEVGVVVEQNFERRLKPKVMVVIDSMKHHLFEPYLLDLAQLDKDNQEKLDSGKLLPSEVERVEIVQDLELDSYDIDIASVRDQYILGKSEKTLFSRFKNKFLKFPKLSHS